MALLPLKSMLLWEQQWHPCAILGGISLLYLIFWFLDMNSLTTFAVVGLILNFIDFIVPIICNSIYGSSAWTGQQEKAYEDICKSIVMHYNNFLSQVRSFYSLRESSPCKVRTIELYWRLCQIQFTSNIALLCTIHTIEYKHSLWLIYQLFLICYFMFQYYIISKGLLCILAWISSSFNTVFLLYLFSVTMFLWPGIQRRGIFNTLLSMVNKAPKPLKSE